MTQIEHRDGFFLLHIHGVEAPMGFFSYASALSFARNNLRLEVAAS